MEGATALVHIQQAPETAKGKVTAKEEKVIVTRGETPRKIIPRRTTIRTTMHQRSSKEIADNGCELGSASAETIALLIIVTK